MSDRVVGSLLCRAVLRLYPAPQRARLGAAIERTFVDRVHAARRHGRLHATAVAAAELGDLFVNALRARQPFAGSGTFAYDARDALRSLQRRPGFAVVVMAILAVGIGASTAMFSVIDSALLRPLPFRDADRIVEVWRMLDDDSRVTSWDPEELRLWDQTGVLERMAGWEVQEVDLTGVGAPRPLTIARVETSTLGFLGERPAYGRDFAEAEGRLGAEPVAMISTSLARAIAASPAEALDTMIELDGLAHRVVAVAPTRFTYPIQGVDAWVPVSYLAADSRLPDIRPRLFARIPPDTTAAVATERANALAEQAGREHRLYLDSSGARGTRTQRALYLLLGGVGLLVLSACANTANVLLAALTERQREIGLRAALGAGRGRLVRQALVQASLLALGGALFGTLVARLLIAAVMDTAPASISRLTANTVDVDPRALLFAVLLAFATAVLFGVVPAQRCAGMDPQAALAGSRTSTDARNRRTRHGLVVVEVAMAVVLLVAAALLTGSLLRLLDTDLGYETDGLYTMTLRPSSTRYPATPERLQLVESLTQRLRAIPGVQHVAASSGLPIDGVSSFSFDLQPEAEGEPVAEKDPDLVIPTIDAGEDYFATLGVPLVDGREFTAEEVRAGAPVVILGGSMARRYFGDSSPVGRGFRLRADEDWSTVVGIAGEVTTMDVPEPFGPMEMYRPLSFDDWFDRLTFLIRAPDDAALGAAIRDAVAAEDPLQPIESIERASNALWNRLIEPRFYLNLAGTFALAALLLAAFGIYGVISYTVNQRTREIGIRMALGAHRGHVQRMVLRLGVALAGAGVLLGLLLSLWVSRLVDAYVYQGATTSPASFVAVAAGMLAVALLACWLPARRALRVHPMEALRAD